MIDYIEDNFKIDSVKTKPATFRNVTGYGRKIPTDKMIRISGHGRFYRLYCMNYSNSGSLYIIKNGNIYFLRNEYDLPC
jgi:hypothetical protein